MSTLPAPQRTHLGVYALIEHGGQYLLVEKTRGTYIGLLDLPGGAPEFGESFEAALVRELAEELSLHVSATDFALCDAIAFTVADGESTLCHRAILYRLTDQAAAVARSNEFASADTAGSRWARVDDPRLSPLARHAIDRTQFPLR